MQQKHKHKQSASIVSEVSIIFIQQMWSWLNITGRCITRDIESHYISSTTACCHGLNLNGVCQKMFSFHIVNW